MEVAQPSVNKILGNDRGNISATLTLIVMITGAIGYFMLVTDQVDSEIRTLSSTQATSYLKSDVMETTKKLLRSGSAGPNGGLPSGPGNCNGKYGDDIRDLFQNFTLSDGQSEFTETIQNAGQVYPDFYAANSDKLNCFFHPQRYGGVNFDLFKITIKRSAGVNLINLSNYLIAEVMIQTVLFGKRHTEKYTLRYRIDALSMSHFGLIFNSSGADNLYDLDDGAFVQINAPVLVDQATRSTPFSLSRLTNFGKPFDGKSNPTKSLTYNESVYLASPTVAQDAASLNFLSTSDLRVYFKDGVIFDVFTNPAQVVPWKIATGQYNELFNYDVIGSGRFPLPRLDSGESAHATSAAGVTNVYGRDKENNPIPDGIDAHNKNTAGIYSLMMGDKSKLYSSCSSVDVSSGVYSLIIFNNLNEDFTIDFSGNTTSSAPPVFCGLIAAKNLTIILNNTEVTSASASDTVSLVNHHFVGKMLLSGKLIVRNKGKLIFTDILELDQDTVSPYEVIDDFTNVQVQYYNQKYYSSQNFTLPFFSDPSIYSEGDYTGGPNRFWVPRDTKNLFNKDCGAPYKCRISPLGSPANSDDILAAHRTKLLYEVFSVE